MCTSNGHLESNQSDDRCREEEVAKLPMPMTRRRGMAARSLLVIIEGCVFACGAYADAVTDWNAIAFNTIPSSVVGPPQARVLGYVHAAIFDAVNAVEPKYTVYAVDVNARGASAEAAAVAAAHGVLSRLYPEQQVSLDGALEKSLKSIADGKAKDQGLSVGKNVAEQTFAASLKDNAMAPDPAYQPGKDPSSWRPYPATQKPRGLTWGGIKPFMLTAADQFAVSGPLSVQSSEYAKDIEEVRVLGARNSSQRTSEQTAREIFWTVSMPNVMMTSRAPKQQRRAMTWLPTPGSSRCSIWRLPIHRSRRGR